MTNATTLATGFLLAASAVVGLAAATAGRRPDDTHQIPLRMAGPFAVVRAQVAGHDAPLRLIVDTAAGATVLDRALAARLDLVDAAPGAAHVSGAGGAAHGITFGKATTLTIAGAQV
ncbi:MAG: aspartyl protease family protein, partial [Vicinamibacterales bacterium]